MKAIAYNAKKLIFLSTTTLFFDKNDNFYQKKNALKGIQSVLFPQFFKFHILKPVLNDFFRTFSLLCQSSCSPLTHPYAMAVSFAMDHHCPFSTANLSIKLERIFRCLKLIAEPCTDNDGIYLYFHSPSGRSFSIISAG